MNALLHSLDIESEIRSWGPQGRYPELEGYWNEAHAGRLGPMENGQHGGPSDQWAAEFNKQDIVRRPELWAEEFQQQGDGWADQFDKVLFLGIFLCLIHIST